MSDDNDGVMGDASSYFSNDTTVTRFKETLATYSQIPIYTSFPNVKRLTLTLPFNPDYQPLETIHQAVKLLITSYLTGFDLHGNLKEPSIWEEQARNCSWRLIFGQVSILISEGCISCVSAYPSISECDALTCAIEAVPKSSVISLVRVPKEFDEKFCKLVASRPFITGVFINPTKQNYDMVCALCGNSKLQRISLIAGTQINKDNIEMSTDLIFNKKPSSAKCTVIGIPVYIKGKDDVATLHRKFKNLERIAYYVATDSEAEEMNDLFEEVYKRHVETSRRN